MPVARTVDGVMYRAFTRIREGQRSAVGTDFVIREELDEAIGGIGGGAPTDARYWLSTPHASLASAVNMGGLASGVLTQTVALGIATPVAVSLTQGAVLFGGSSGPASVGQAATNIYYDALNARLIVGNGGTYTPAPGAALTVGIGGAQIHSLDGSGNQLVRTGPTGILSRAVPNTDFPANDALYVVRGPASAPPNAFNLRDFDDVGLLAVDATSGAAATILLRTMGPREVLFGGSDFLPSSTFNFQFDNANTRLVMGLPGYVPAPGAMLTLTGSGNAQIGALAGTGSALVQASSSGLLSRAGTTDRQVLFGASGGVGQDADLQWDSTNNRLMILSSSYTPAPGAALTNLGDTRLDGTVGMGASPSGNTKVLIARGVAAGPVSTPLDVVKVAGQTVDLSGTGTINGDDANGYGFVTIGAPNIQLSAGAVIAPSTLLILGDPLVSGGALGSAQAALRARGTAHVDRLGVGTHPQNPGTNVQFAVFASGTRDMAVLSLAGGNVLGEGASVDYLQVALNQTFVAASTHPGKVYGTNFTGFFLSSLAGSPPFSPQIIGDSTHHVATVRIGGPQLSGDWTSGSTAGLMSLYVDSGTVRIVDQLVCGKFGSPHVFFAQPGTSGALTDGFLGFWGAAAGPGRPTLTGSKSSGSAFANLLGLLGQGWYNLFFDNTGA